MISFCDSCTDEKEVTEIKDRGESFYWCAECKEEDERIASLPTCLNCENPIDNGSYDEICQSCEDKAIFYGSL